MSIPKSSSYYKAVVPFSSDVDQEILNVIDKIYTKYPYYGHRRVHKLLERFGFNIGRKKVRTAMKLMGIIALYPKPKTTIANKEHQKYPYLLKAFKNDKNQVVIDKPNQVWVPILPISNWTKALSIWLQSLIGTPKRYSLGSSQIRWMYHSQLGY
ncbi:MAG: IS3 family transposase [Sulfurovum sp.]|nr:IS3 family transposase [Sulfurovum sp.]